LSLYIATIRGYKDPAKNKALGPINKTLITRPSQKYSTKNKILPKIRPFEK
jgi:hypothetical protein